MYTYFRFNNDNNITLMHSSRGNMFSRGHDKNQNLGRIGHSKIGPFLLMLLFSKLLFVSGTFVSFDILQSASLIQVISTQLICSAILYMLLHQPSNVLRTITKPNLIKLLLNALWYGSIMLLWGTGLRLVGPIRAVLLFDHHETVVIACISYLIAGNDKNKSRGAMLFVAGVIMLLFLDNDAALGHHIESNDESHLTHVLYAMFDQLGVPDHKHGVLVLILALVLSALQRSFQKKLAVETGGNKKLHALTVLISGLILFVPTVYQFFDSSESIANWFVTILPWSILISISVVANSVIDSLTISKLDTNRVVKYSAMISFFVTLLIGYFWHGPLIVVSGMEEMHHHISGGVLIATVFLTLATLRLSKHSAPHSGTFIGYAESGLPMYAFDKKDVSSKFMPFVMSTLNQIMSSPDSRQIFYFLCINLFFCGVELLYGIWTNSLGLISDGFHMLFDCAALLVGLLAALMQKWPKTRVYSYGFARVDMLSGYVNGLLLCVVAFFVFTEAVERLIDPPEISTDRLFIVSVAGLVVNLIGIFAFSHAHTHGGAPCTGHDSPPVSKNESKLCSDSTNHNNHGHSHEDHGHNHGDHSHSHGGHGHNHGGHGHSHNSKTDIDCSGHGHGHGHSHDSSEHNENSHGHSHKEKRAENRNLQGVFLHIMADTLGSVGVILSSLCIEYFGWFRSDPLCSMIIAVLIFLSVIPLLKDSIMVLLQRVPKEDEGAFYTALDKISKLDNVVNIYDPHLWQYSSAVKVVSVRVYVNARANEQQIISDSKEILQESGFSECSIQVDKELFRKALQSYGPSLLDSADKYNLGVYSRNENVLSFN